MIVRISFEQGLMIMQTLLRRRDRKGSVLVIAAVSLTALIGMSAIAVDVGRLYVAKGRAQNICDSSALAGACFLNGATSGEPGSETAAQSNAASNVSNLNKWKIWNSVTGGSQGVAVSWPTTILTATNQTLNVNEGAAVRVDGWVQVDYGLAKIFGQTSGRAKASAIATFTQMVSYGGSPLIPFAIALSSVSPDAAINPSGRPIYEQGVTYNLTTGDWQSNFLGPGNFGLLDFPDGNGGSGVRDAIAGKLGAVLSIGDTISTSTGKKTGPVKQGMGDRLDGSNYSDGQFAKWVTDGRPVDKRVVVCPVIDDGQTTNGHKPVTIVGFAAFYIDSYSGSSTVTGRFIEAIFSGQSFQVVPGLGGTSVPSDGKTAVSIHLVS